MANGIDWFRWHHGSVTDPKFQLIARKAKQPLGNVIAVWAYLLETASASQQRGLIVGIDVEAVDCLLGAEDGTTAAIMAAMTERGLIDDGVIVSWEKRQPKRERADDTSTARVQAFRERQRHETPSNAMKRQETPREEKSREEKSNTPQPPDGGANVGANRGAALFDEFWAAFPRKVGKDAALKAFEKRRPDRAMLDQMLAAIAKQRASPDWQKDGGQFIPHPTTWLNQGRWQDEVTVVSAAEQRMAGWSEWSKQQALRLFPDGNIPSGYVPMGSPAGG